MGYPGRGGVFIGKRTVLIDEDGGLKATCTAEFLAAKGSKVEILTRLPYVGMDLSPPSFEPQYQRLFEKGVILTPFTAIKEIRGNTIVAYHSYSKQERQIDGIDQVVLVMGNKADDELYFSLKGGIRELYRVGDCIAPRGIMDAIREGHLLGWSV